LGTLERGEAGREMKFWSTLERGGEGRQKAVNRTLFIPPAPFFYGILVFCSPLLGQGFVLQIGNRREEGGKRNETLGTLERGEEGREGKNL
jgi:hypothetical protein